MRRSMYGPASSTTTSNPASASTVAVTAPPAPEPTTTKSHSSSRPEGARSPSGEKPSTAAAGASSPTSHRDLVADRRLHAGVVAVPEPREHLQEQGQVALDRRARVLASSEEVLAGLEARPREPPRKRQPLEEPAGRDGSGRRCAREHRQQRLQLGGRGRRLPRCGFSRPAAGGRLPKPRRHRLGEGAQVRRSAGRACRRSRATGSASAAPGSGARLQVAAAGSPTRPASD